MKGRIVVCDTESSGEPELLAGAAGSVMQILNYNDTPFPYPFPAAVVSSTVINTISAYINSSRNPTAIIMKSTASKDPLAPYVPHFSSRGPNPISKNILKPDVSAPGVTILAAWSPLASPSDNEEDTRAVPYNIISGTSMSCPHVTGVAAYIKTFHPSWSPAAIKSALMTTASPMNPTINTDAEFAYGVGHINPIKATNPGLVYDANELDYIKFLCMEGYSSQHIRLITGSIKNNCSGLKTKSYDDLNYPSITYHTLRQEPFTKVIIRTVTNVGSPSSTYKAFLTKPSSPNVQIDIKPKVLKFKALGQKLNFLVGIDGEMDGEEDPIVYASLVWDDGVHQVRSPIVVYVPS